MTGNRTLSLREEYAFDKQSLKVRHYSYNLIDSNAKNLLRADNLSYHRTDYRGRTLAHPSHHMHDERGRVRSFSGHVEDFISQAKSFLVYR